MSKLSTTQTWICLQCGEQENRCRTVRISGILTRDRIKPDRYRFDHGTSPQCCL